MKKDQIKKETKLVVKKEKKVVVKPTVKLVSYTMKAVIPTMSYGNLQPEITVEAGSIEEASKIVLEHINWLYEVYSDGNPKFLITKAVNEKKNEVVPPSILTPEIKAPEAKKEDVSTVSEPFNKAKKAIDGAMSIEATQIIEDQIQKSVRLTPEEKPKLLEAILFKRKEIRNK